MGLIDHAIDRVNLHEYPTTTTSYPDIRVVLVDRAVNEHGLFLEACQKKGIEAILYDGSTRHSDIINQLSKITKNGNGQRKIISVGIVFHGTGNSGGVFLDGESFFSEKNTQWLANLCHDQHLERLDFISCETAKHNTWSEFYTMLEKKTGVLGTAIGRSDKLVGNASNGGSWIMNYATMQYGRDISKDYFDQDVIVKYNAVLMSSVISSMIASAILPTSVTLTYTFSGSFSGTIYLYRFSGYSAPSTNPTSGNQMTSTIYVSDPSPFINDANDAYPISKNTQYTYAWYNGNGTSSTIYNPAVTVKTYADITTLTPSLIDFTTTQINYTLRNTLSQTTNAYLFRFNGSRGTAITLPTTLATGTLNQTQVGSAISISTGSNAIPTVISGNVSATGLIENTYYLYAFYDGTENGSRLITNTLSNTVSTYATTFATAANGTLTISNTANTSALISYRIDNGTVQTTLSQLYRFAGSSAPTSSPDTSGTIVDSLISTLTNTSSTGQILSTGLNVNTQYTYAFYDNTTKTILCNVNGVSQSVTFRTANALNTSLTATNITPVSAIITGILSNNPSSISTTVYLYRYLGPSVPSTLDSSGTQLKSQALNANGSGTATYTDTSLNINNQYTYAWYDGSSNSVSQQLTSNGTILQSVFVNTTVNTVAFSSTTNILNNSATIHFILTNNNGTTTTVPSYLYRFTSTPPTTLTSAGSYVNSANSLNTAASINDTGLTTLTRYYYAFYNGQVNGTSTIITNLLGLGQSTDFYTSNLYNGTLTVSPLTIFNTSATVSYSISNVGSNAQTATPYLYRFDGSGTAQTVLNASGTFIYSPGSIQNRTITGVQPDSGLTPSTYYTYAWYQGNSLGQSVQLLNASGGTYKSYTIQTTNFLLTDLSATYVNQTSANVHYNITNLTTSQGITCYLYRFTSIPPTTLYTDPYQKAYNGQTPITSIPITGGGTTSATYNDTPLNTVAIYYYAVYNGNIDDPNQNASAVLYINPTANYYIKINDYVIVNSISASNVNYTSAKLSYQLQNVFSIDASYYLYRFTNSPVRLPNTNVTPPASNPTSGTQIKDVSGTIVVGQTIGLSTYTDPSLNKNTSYTYAFYNGTSGSSKPLEDINGNIQYAYIVTSEYISNLTSSAIDSSSITINYTITNPLYDVSQVAYFYRFTDTIAPATDPSNTPTAVLLYTTNQISPLTSVTSSYQDTGLTVNVAYTYAFYSYNSDISGTDTLGTILTSLGNSIECITPITDRYVNYMIVQENTNNYIDISYSISSSNANQNINAYLYRFLGSGPPPQQNPSSGTYLLNSNSIASYYYDMSLNFNQIYTYAFYDGSSSTANLLYLTNPQNSQTGYSPNWTQSSIGTGGNNNVYTPTNYSSTSAYVTTTTTNQAVSYLVANYIHNVSVDISASITNASATIATNVYLIRYTGTIPPTIYDGLGTGIYDFAPYNIATSLAAAGTNSYLFTDQYTIYNNYSQTGTSLVPATTYNYAFYNGIVSGVSNILPITATPGVNYLSVNTVGLIQSVMTNTLVTETTANINYTIQNVANSSNTTIYLYYKSGVQTAPSTLNTSTWKDVSNIYITPGTTAQGTFSAVDLSANTIYTYAFYNGNTNGISDILMDATVNGNNQYTYFKTGLSDASLSTVSVLNTKATLSYTLSNGTSIPLTGHLYYFAGTNTAPTKLNGSGITGIDVSHITILSNTSVTNTITVTSLNPNTQYTFAFYNGDVSGTSTILTTVTGSAVSDTLTTTYLYNNILALNALTGTTVDISYVLTNNSVTANTYLYQFSNSQSAPTTLTGGTLVSGFPVSVGSSGVTNHVALSGLTINTYYTYAFYNGNTVGTSTILTDTIGSNQYMTIFTTTNDLVTDLSYNTLLPHGANIVYSLTNFLPNQNTVYLYRFDGSNAPVSDPTTGTAVLSVDISGMYVDSSGIEHPTIIPDTTYTGDAATLTSNQQYTYAFYSTNTSAGAILKDASGISKTITFYPTDQAIVASLTNYNTTNNRAVITGTVSNSTNNLPNQLYLYRYPSTITPPKLLNTSTASFIINWTSTTPIQNDGVSYTYSVEDPSLNAATRYNYALYSGNVNGTSIILTYPDGNPYILNVAVPDVYNTSISASVITTNTVTISYTVSNAGQFAPITVYLYRFSGTSTGSITAPQFLTTDNSATLISSRAINTNTTSYSGTMTDYGASPNTYYTYALYDGSGVQSTIINP